MIGSKRYSKECTNCDVLNDDVIGSRNFQTLSFAIWRHQVNAEQFTNTAYSLHSGTVALPKKRLVACDLERV
jgi:hypothetical protein